MTAIGLGLAMPFVAMMGRQSSPVSILGSSLIAWWTADRADLITLNSTAVTSWKDVVAGYDAVQSVSAARPLYSATSFNGAPGLTFDGVDDELTCTSAGLLSALPDGAEAAEAWAITQQNALVADTGAKIMVSWGGAASTSRRGLERIVTTGVNRSRVTTGDGGSTISLSGSSVDLSSRHVMRARWSATDHTIATDGGAGTSGAVVPATTASRLRIGSISNTSPGNFWFGPCRDLLITGALSAQQITDLQAWALPRRNL